MRHGFTVLADNSRSTLLRQCQLSTSHMAGVRTSGHSLGPSVSVVLTLIAPTPTIHGAIDTGASVDRIDARSGRSSSRNAKRCAQKRAGT
jgi:hypothetical protein